MAKQRDTFGRAVDAIAEGLRAGRFAPGAPLVIQDIADELRLSPTPVREALAYLSGAEIIDGHREHGRGYAAPRLEAGRLRDLYELHGACVRVAVQRRRRPPPWGPGGAQGLLLSRLEPEAGAAGDLVGASAALFSALTAQAANAALARTQARLGERLTLARRIESDVLGTGAAELLKLAEAADAEDAEALDADLAAYHLARTSRVEEIAARLVDGWAATKNI